MDNSLVMGIINNAILLLGLGVIFSLIPLDDQKTKISNKIIIGAFVSVIVILVMLSPFEIAPGVVLDTRSILISVVALFFGSIPTLMAVFSASLFRIYQGGAGALTGVLVIISSGGIGLLFRIYRFDKIKERKLYRIVELYLFGILVHIVMLIMFFTLPKELRIPILRDISLFVLLIYPIVTVVYSTLMFIRHDNITNTKKLLQSQHNFVVAVEEAPIPVAIHSKDGKFIVVNTMWTKMSGYTIDDIPTTTEWIKKTCLISNTKKVSSNIATLLLTNGQIHEKEIKIKTKDNQIRTWNFYSSILENTVAGEKVVLSIATDVTERRKLEKKLTRLSFHDELTTLYNRRFYETEITRLNTKRNYPLTLLMGDVNGLKIINDSFGHLVGDDLLKTTARVLKETCRDDDIITRLGGDEFLIILPNTTSSQANNLAKRITANLTEHKIKGIGISISFGYASLTSENNSVEKVFIAAENAMYQKKLLESPSIRGFAIDVILKAIFEINSETEIHSKTVANYAAKIAAAMNLPQAEIVEIKTAALLHDIGKIATPVSIFSKKGKLTETEYEEVKKHPERGYRILSSGPNMKEIATSCLHHHERWDGLGYPNSLKGKDIPVQSRIISLADAYDAMISKRTYKTALTKEEAIEEIKRNMGTQFDPEIAKVFINKVLLKSKN